MKFSNFSHKTPHLKGKQHQLDPNLDMKQLVHHATVQYVDRDADGDVDVFDNPKKKTPDENVSSASKAQEYSNKLIAKQKGEIKHTKRGIAYEETLNEKPRIARKPGQPANSKKHSDLYTDENPKGTISGLGFKDVATAKQSVSKIKDSGKTHAHKIQAAIAMEQRAKVMGKSSEAAVFRSFINSMKKKTKKINEESESKKCKSGYYYCNTNKECKPLPSGFNTPGQTIKPTEVGIGVPVEGSCNHTKKGKICPKHGMKDCTLIGETLNSVTEEGLRAWFGKSKSKDGKSGWVQSDGSPCANEPGETKTPKCFSRSKLASMTKGEIASAVRRKREQDPGQQQKTGASKPTYVPTDSPTKKMKEEFFKENHKEIADGREKDEEGYMASTEMDTIDSAVKKLRKNIKKGDMQLPAWVQSKITKAADYIDTAADYLDSEEMSEESDKKGKGSGTKDACYTKVKSRYSVWPSAYASGALVKCRKVGAANWGNSSKNEEIVHEGDFWHPDPEKDKKLGGPGPNQRAREDRAAKPKEDSKKLRPGESYMDYAKRKQRGESFVPGKLENLSPISLKVLEDLNLDEKCWSGYKKKGMKTMFGKRYPNCVKVEEASFEIGAGHNLAKKTAKIRNLATGTTNPNEKSAALKKLSGPSLPLADSFELKNNTNVTIEDLEGNTFVEVVDLIRPEPITGFKSQVKEATRLQADTGNIIAVILSWRGKTYSVRMFFPQVGMPNKNDITAEIQKIYPSALVLQYKVSSLQPGMPLIQVVNSKSKNYNMNEESAAWQRKEGKNPEGGLNKKGIASYRAQNPGSKLSMAVTTEPSKLKPGSKAANRRKSFCARMSGMPGPMKGEKGRPTRKALSLRKWNC